MAYTLAGTFTQSALMIAEAREKESVIEELKGTDPNKTDRIDALLDELNGEGLAWITLSGEQEYSIGRIRR